MLERSISLFAVILLLHFAAPEILFSEAFSLDPLKNADPITGSSPGLSRRQWVNVPIAVGGAVFYGKLLSTAGKKLRRGDFAYPDAHEEKMKSTIKTAVIASIPASQSKNENDAIKKLGRPLRVLEVGTGKNCRVIRRGLFDDAFLELSFRGVTEIELTGVDIVPPSTAAIQDAQDVLSRRVESAGVSFKFVEGSLTSGLDFQDGYFDCVVCSLTLCSVDDQAAALNEIKRVLKSKGGSFGYMEHVAVDSDEPYRLLEFQQQAFDGLQQIVADNCHLHRFTEDNIYTIFGIAEGTNTAIARERFLVDDMWPVSCQTCGVIKLL